MTEFDKQGPPFPSEPIVDKSGMISRYWWYFFNQVFKKTKKADDTEDLVVSMTFDTFENYSPRLEKIEKLLYSLPSPRSYANEINHLTKRLEAMPTVMDHYKIPVGGIYLSSTGVNPNTELGYGTWTKVAIGQFLIGAT